MYGASDDGRWERFGLDFDVGSLVISDPRRFSRVRFGTDSSILGPDAMSVTADEFVARLENGGRRSIKAVLLDQTVVAGLGNMLVDDILLRVGIDPRQSVTVSTTKDLRRLHAVMCTTLPELLARGGSHAGLLAHTLRRPGAPCPLDGAPLERCTVAGRTTFVCPAHQRGAGSAD